MPDKKYIIRAYHGNVNSSKALISANFGGISDQIDWPEFKFGEENKTVEFLKKFPLGKVPAMDTPDGPLFESNALARYISRVGNSANQLLGSTPYEQSRIDMWIDFSSFYITENSYPLFAFHFSWGGPFHKEMFERKMAEMHKAWGWLETHLKEKGTTYLEGNQVTLADIILCVAHIQLFKYALDAEFRNKYPTMNAYFTNFYRLPQVAPVVGEIIFLEKFVEPTSGH